MAQNVTPYGEGGDKKTQVTSMFDRIAPFYDLLNGVLSLGIDTIWRRKAIRKISDHSVDNLLDIATGTADLAIEANKQLSPKKIVALDISKEMINLAKKKVLKQNLDQTIFPEVGDSEQLRFDEGQFDAVTVSFGVRNFGNLEQGLREIHRVLNKGGKLMVLEFSRPTIFPFKQLFNFYFKNILPVIGRLTSKDQRAYKYLYESVQAFPDYDQFAIILKQIGFRDVKWTPLSLGICTIYVASKI